MTGEKRIRGVIFDFDGTLVTQEIDFARISSEIEMLADGFSIKLPSKRMPILEMLDEISRINRANPALQKFQNSAFALLEKREMEAGQKASVLAGIRSFLKNLARAGYRIGIVTRNCRKVVETLAKRHRIAYHYLLSRDDVSHVKPHPKHITSMRKCMGLKPHQLLVVGDHPFDIVAARRLNILSCGVLSGGKHLDDFVREGADFVFPDITGLDLFFSLRALPEGKIHLYLLRYLLKKYNVTDSSVISGPGIGTDAAVVRIHKPLAVLKSDPISIAGADAAEHALSVNANDIAAAGARPRWLLATFLFPQGTRFAEVEDTFEVVANNCRKNGVCLVGGHTEITSAVRWPVILCSLIGEPVKMKPAKFNAKGALVLAGEIGVEGAAILARRYEKELKRLYGGLWKKAVNGLYRPGISIVRPALLAWEKFPVAAMHDPTEGGFSAAVHELAERLGCGFVIHEKNLQIFEPARVFSSYFGIDVLGLISSGCLLVAISEGRAGELVKFYKSHGIPACIAGTATDDFRVTIVRKNGKITDLPFTAQDEIVKVQSHRTRSGK